MKTRYGKSLFFIISAFLLTWSGVAHSGQMESGPSFEQNSSQGEGSAAGPRSWIILDSSAVGDIERNNAFLKRQAPNIKADLRDLKRLGIIDQDSLIAIETVINQAQTNMAHLLAGKQSRKLSPKKAAAISDDLVSQAETLESYIEDIDGGSGAGPQRAFEKQEHLVEVLSHISRMLDNTGRVVRRCIGR